MPSRITGSPGEVFVIFNCGGLLALPFLDDEPGVGVSHGGTGLVVGLNEHNATPGNVARAMLLATIFNLKLGSDLLTAQGYPRSEIILSGGLTQTPALAQIIADAFNTPIVLLSGAQEGTAWGATLMAKFRAGRLAGDTPAWQAFLAAHATGTPTRFTPSPKAVATLATMFNRYQKLLALHSPLAAAVG